MEVSRPHESGFARVRGFAGWGVFILVFLFYFLSSCSNGFLYDDHEVLLEERLGLSLSDLAELFSERHYPFLPYYRPLTRLSFVVQKALHGDNPLYFHLVNALLAGWVAYLVFRLCRCRAFRIDARLATVASLVFAFHPMTSSIVFPAASGRETLVPLAFMLLGLRVYLEGGKRSRLYAFVAAVFALFSKESAIILPLLYFAADLTGLSESRPRNMAEWVRNTAPYGFLLAGYFWIRWQIFAGLELQWSDGRLMLPASYLYALQSIFTPTLQLHYEPVTTAAWFDPLKTFFAFACLGIILYGLGRLETLRPWRTAAFWGSVAFLGLLPTANLLWQDAPFSERYAVPALLACLMVAVLRVRGLKRQPAVLGFGLAIAALFAFMSINRSLAFRNNVAFCEQWVKTSPDYFLPYYNLAKSYELADRRDEAEAPYLKSIELNPDWPSSYLNLASLAISDSEYEKALKYLAVYLELEPDSERGYYTRGLAFHEMKDFRRAALNYERAVAIDPGFLDAIVNLGVVYFELGRNAEARGMFVRALGIDPENARVLRNLSILGAATGR